MSDDSNNLSRPIRLPRSSAIRERDALREQVTELRSNLSTAQSRIAELERERGEMHTIHNGQMRDGLALSSQVAELEKELAVAKEKAWMYDQLAK